MLQAAKGGVEGDEASLFASKSFILVSMLWKESSWILPVASGQREQKWQDMKRGEREKTPKAFHDCKIHKNNGTNGSMIALMYSNFHVIYLPW